MNADLAKIMSQSPASHWKHDYIREDKSAVVRWLPIAQLVDPQFSQGITSDGVWVTESADGLFPIGAHRPPAMLLPILECSREAVVATLRDAAMRAGLPGDIALSFPWDSIVACGLSTSSYWAELAMNWIETYESIRWPIDAFIPLLQKLSQDKKRHSQHTRHRALAILRSLEGHNRGRNNEEIKQGEDKKG